MDCNSTDNQYLVKIADLEAKNEELRNANSILEARVEELEVRLEIDHYYIWDQDPDHLRGWKKILVPKNERKEQIDGIECRDCTIKLQDDHIKNLTAVILQKMAEMYTELSEDEVRRMLQELVWNRRAGEQDGRN
jgi:type VI protein secretion system component VasK